MWRSREAASCEGAEELPHVKEWGATTYEGVRSYHIWRSEELPHVEELRSYHILRSWGAATCGRVEKLLLVEERWRSTLNSCQW
jgi:hypothetical protein